jgi:release factor glutamine methyltransferase
MKVKEALHKTSVKLDAASIEDAALEAELLLMHAMSLERAGLYTRLGDELPSQYGDALSGMVRRRLSHEPSAYILGHREFYGLDFIVGPGVLIPRPETETLVEEAAAFIHRAFPCGDPVIADIGTGSGAVAVSLAYRFPDAKVYATDLSARALDIAALNCMRHGVRVDLIQGDLLEPLPHTVDIIAANLPYVSDGDMIGLSAEIRDHEPRIALSGGADGLNIVRRLIVNAPERLRPGGSVFLEIAPSQAEVLASWANSSGFWSCVSVLRDCAGFARVLKLILTKQRLEV